MKITALESVYALEFLQKSATIGPPAEHTGGTRRTLWCRQGQETRTRGDSGWHLDEMAAPHQGPYAAMLKRCPVARDVQIGNPIARRGLMANYMIESGEVWIGW